MPRTPEFSDPIVEQYGRDSVTKLGAFYGEALHVLYQARKSANSNRNFSEKERSAYDELVRGTRHLLASFRVNIVINNKTGQSRPKSSYRNLIQEIEGIRPPIQTNLALVRSERRRKMTYVTDIDSSISALIHDFEDICSRLELMKRAIGPQVDSRAIEAIYRQVLSDHLGQENAPFLFEIVEYVINLRIQQTDVAADNSTVRQGIAHLIHSSSQLLAALEQSNADRRFVSAVKDYCDVVAHKFNPILLDLLSNRLRAFMVELKNELSGFIIAETTALLLSQDQVLRQIFESCLGVLSFRRVDARAWHGDCCGRSRNENDAERGCA
jgi:hypothetical protein